MKLPISLNLRLTLLLSIVATLVFLSFGWIMESSIQKHFELGDIKELKLIANAVEKPLISLQANHNLVQLKQRFDDILIGHHNPLLRIIDSSGKLLYNSPQQDLSLVPLPPFELPSQANIQQWNNAKHSYLILIKQIVGKNKIPYTVIIAVATDFHRHFLTNFRITLWFMVLSGIIVMGLMSWLVVRYGHRPLHRIVDQISHISINELNTRLAPETVPAELTELAVSFNDLLQRLEEAFNQLSHFSADIAHELRTPITNIMTQSQVALSQTRSVKEYQEILYSNMEEYERLAQMIGDMLFLAKADNSQSPTESEYTDVNSEVRNLFDYYGAWAEECNVTLSLEGNSHVHCNRLMLRRALSNLLSNAIRHTPKGQSVTVRLETHNKEVAITVQNPGALIPPEHLSKLFDRFYRIDPSRQYNNDGTGLGLAIVKSIVDIHSGKISVSSDETATRFKITLPVTQPRSEK